MADITITISGKAKTGKTVIAYFLEKYLLALGSKVEFKDIDNPTNTLVKEIPALTIERVFHNVTVLIQEVHEKHDDRQPETYSVYPFLSPTQ